MPLRIPWTEHEVALLIDAYLHVAEGADLGHTAEELSMALRNVAIRKGLNIDDTYRNVNGMKMQLANTQYLFTDGRKGLSGASSLIRQMVEMYRERPEEFNHILKEANQLTGQPMSVEDAFFAYAKGKTGLSLKALADYLKKAADYCHLKQPLLGMTDVVAVRNAQQKVAEEKLLRFRYGKDAQTIRNVTQLYYNFVKSYHEKPVQPIDEPAQSTKPVEKPTQEMQPQQQIESISVDHTVDPIAEKKTLIDAPALPSCKNALFLSRQAPEAQPDDETKKVDFRQDASYEFTKPVSCIYRGKQFGCTSWNKLYVDLCGMMFVDYHDVFMTVMNGDVPGYNTLAFADEQHMSALRYPRRFAPGYYLEGNISATNLVRRIRGLHQLFGLDNELCITYRSTKNTPSLKPDEQPEEWIIAQLKARKIPYQDKRSLGGCLWIRGDMELPIPLSECQERKYNLHYKQDGCRIWPNEPAWWTTDQPMQLEKPDKPYTLGMGVDLAGFRDFLIQQQRLAERTANGYASALRSIETYLQERKLPISILRATAEDVQNTIESLMARPDFVKLNNDRHHQYLAAMRQLTVFLRGDVNFKIPSAHMNSNTIIEAVFVVLRDAKQPLTLAQIHQEILNGQLYNFNTDNGLNMVRHAVYTQCLTNKERIARGEEVIIQTSDAGLNQYQLMTAKEASVFLYGKDITPADLPPEVKTPQLEPPEPQDDGLIERLENAVLEADLSGITVEELAAKLGAAVLPVRKAAQASMNLVSIGGRLIHKEAFVDWEDGANRLEAILEKLMVKNNGYISDVQLYEYARFEMQMFLNDNGMDDQRKVFDMAEHLFEKEGYHGKRYTFWMKTHISLVKETITSKLDIMRKYARDNGGFFREEDLENYLNGLGIKTASLRQQMKVYEEPIFLFYEPGTFITAESMCIDDDWLAKARNALQKLFDDTGDHVVLRDIQPWWYTLLPELPGGKVWTALLLQSVLFHYSKQVGAKTIYGLINQTGDTLNAMVVSLGSEISTFADAAVSVLLEDQIDQREFDAEELRQLLVKRGLIAGNELIWNLPKAIPSDERFVWSVDGQRVSINL